MIFAAIDPGAVNAAIAVFHDGKPTFVDDLCIACNMVDAVALAKLLEGLKVEQVVVENVHSMPLQGVASTFKFGMGTGIIHGVTGALRLPLTLVAPTVWKAFHRLGPDKDMARKAAIQHWPQFHNVLERKKDANRAEALLIGDWFYIKHVVPRTSELGK